MPRVVVFIQSVAICFAFSGCGKEDRSPVPGPTIDVETELKPGMTAEAVFTVLGKPDRDERPKEYPNHEIREVAYDAYGLELMFHVNKGLGRVYILRRWNNNAVQGHRCGDVIEPGELGYDGESFSVKFTSKTWPEGTFYVEDKHDANGIRGRIREIMLGDGEVVGAYVPVIKTK